MVNRDFDEIIDFDNENHRVSCEKPYRKLFISRYGDHGLIFECVEYKDALNIFSSDTNLFFFDDWNTELLFDWIQKEVLDK